MKQIKNCEVKHYDLNVDGFDSTLFIIVDLADDIIGSCMLFHDGLMQDFHIISKFRRAGLGSYLFDGVEKIAKEKNIKELFGHVGLKNTALKFWTKKGFSSVIGNHRYFVTKEIKCTQHK